MTNVRPLTLEEQATNYATFRHIETVRNLLNDCVMELLSRGKLHDQSKLQAPEVTVFTDFTPRLAASEYGSDEYKGFLAEMLVDWRAASQRHDNGCIHKSIEINTVRFKLSPQLAGILRNTAEKLWPKLSHAETI